MKQSRDQRVETLSEVAGGRFKLTTLVIKRMREYYLGGRTFMPRVRNQDELMDMVLDQIERKEIALREPGAPPAALNLNAEAETEDTAAAEASG